MASKQQNLLKQYYLLIYFFKDYKTTFATIFRLIPPARWARQRLNKNPNLKFSDKAKI